MGFTSPCAQKIEGLPDYFPCEWFNWGRFRAHYNGVVVIVELDVFASVITLRCDACAGDGRRKPFFLGAKIPTVAATCRILVLYCVSTAARPRVFVCCDRL